MLAVISPAKTLDFESEPATTQYSQPELLDRAAILVNHLACMAPHELSELMSISDKLGSLNFERYQQWALPFAPENARQALLAFKGDVYTGIDAGSFDDEDLRFAQDHLRILSGLYGVLRPLDLMQPYRLEMGTRLEVSADEQGKPYTNLYQFWGGRITQSLNEVLLAADSPVLVNLASNEYFKSVRASELRAQVITPVFKDYRNGSYKVISFLAKKARGAMTAYLIKQRLTDPEQLKAFADDGYAFNEALSGVSQWVFTRKP